MGRKKLSHQRRAQIIEAFYSCARRDGLKKATNREISKEAGVQLSILHHYFRDRDEMISELIAMVARSNMEKYQVEVASKLTGDISIEKAIGFLYGTIFNDDDGSLFYDLWSEAKRNESVRESFVSLYRNYRELIIQQLDSMGLTDNLTESECKNFATIILSMQEGALLQWDMDRENVRPNEVAAVVSAMIRTYLEKRDDRFILENKEAVNMAFYEQTI